MYRLLSVFFLLSSFTIYAQENASITIDLADIEADKKFAIPFSAIQVMDVRFDRSNIGSVEEVVSVNNKKLHRTTPVFPDSFNKYLPFIFNKVVELDRERKDTLMLLVKQFRITDHLMDGVQRQYEPKLLVKLSVSFFKLKDNQLTRLFSIDDLVIKKWNDERRLTKDLLTEFRKGSLVSIFKSLLANRNWQASGANFPIQLVKESIEKRFQLPVYSRSGLTNGVYSTFKDFKNNQPSLMNVSFTKKKDDVEVIDSTGKKLDLANYWGVCFENKRYIVFRGELNELLPSDKSFRFLSYSQTNDLAGRAGYGEYAQQTGLVPAALLKAKHNIVSRHYFYLNMDEEEIYLEEVFGRSNLKQMQKDVLK